MVAFSSSLQADACSLYLSAAPFIQVLSFGTMPYARLTSVETAISVGIGVRLAQPADCSAKLYKLMLRM